MIILASPHLSLAKRGWCWPNLNSANTKARQQRLAGNFIRKDVPPGHCGREPVTPGESGSPLCRPLSLLRCFNSVGKEEKRTRKCLSLGSQVSSHHQPLGPCHPAWFFALQSPLASRPCRVQPSPWKPTTATMGGPMQKVKKISRWHGSSPWQSRSWILLSTLGADVSTLTDTGARSDCLGRRCSHQAAQAWRLGSSDSGGKWGESLLHRATWHSHVSRPYVILRFKPYRGNRNHLLPTF